MQCTPRRWTQGINRSTYVSRAGPRGQDRDCTSRAVIRLSYEGRFVAVLDGLNIKPSSSKGLPCSPPRPVKHRIFQDLPRFVELDTASTIIPSSAGLWDDHQDQWLNIESCRCPPRSTRSSIDFLRRSRSTCPAMCCRAGSPQSQTTPSTRLRSSVPRTTREAVDAGLRIMRASAKAFSTDRCHPRSDAAHTGELPRRGCTVALIQFPWEPRGRATNASPVTPLS